MNCSKVEAVRKRQHLLVQQFMILFEERVNEVIETGNALVTEAKGLGRGR
jgi:hypothetical protein